MKNILITGGAGFIGTRLCERLFDKGNTITVLDNLSEQVHGRDKSILLERIKNKCIFIKGDVTNKDDWEKAIKNQDIIIHLAAETGTGQSMYEIEKYNNVNVMGTALMFELLANTQHGIKKIILASSRAVYGEGKYNCSTHGIQYPTQRKQEDLKNGLFNLKCSICGLDLDVFPTDEKSQLSPSSIYAISKQYQESIVVLMGETLSIPTVVFRYQNVYGPGQSLLNPYTGILSIFSTSILNGNNIEIYEDGEEIRDFVYIDDVVEATILGVEREEADGHIFNVGSGTVTTVLEVAETLKRLYDANIAINISNKFRAGDIRHNFADLSKLKDILGFTSKYSFKKGIVEFVNWVKNQEIMTDQYNKSTDELRKKGLIK